MREIHDPPAQLEAHDPDILDACRSPQEMHEIVAEWGGTIFFDGAHQLGLVASSRTRCGRAGPFAAIW